MFSEFSVLCEFMGCSFFFFLNWLTRVVSSVISGFQKRKHDFFKCEYCLSKWDNIYDNLSSLSCTNQ